MRRPQPLPTPPRRAPEAAPAASSDATSTSPAVANRWSRRAPSAPTQQHPDEVATDVDLPTFDTWQNDVPAQHEQQHEDAAATDADAETAVIDDGGVFVRDEPTLAPVVPIVSEPDAEPEPSVAQAVPSRPRRTDASAPDERASAPATLTGWRDVLRASRAHRKALRREVRRFTVRSRRRRLAWIISLSAVLAVVIGSFAVAYSPLFAIEKITIAGTETIDAAAVHDALASEIGSPLAAVDRASIQQTLAEFPAVETYSLEARPPHELVVRIVERTPVGVVATSAGYDLVDAAGVTLSTTPEPPAGQPVISVDGGPSSAAFTAVGTIIRSVPASIRSQLSAVSATTPYDVSLTLADTGTMIVWGSAEDSAQKALVLETIMAAKPATEVSVYDVSSPENVIVR